MQVKDLVCHYKDYQAAIVNEPEVVLTTGKWLIESVQEVAKSTTKWIPIPGITAFSDGSDEFLVHSRGDGLMGVMPDRLSCIFSKESIRIAEGDPWPGSANTDAVCDVTSSADFAFNLRKFANKDRLGLAAYKGTLVVYDKSKQKVLRSYHGVLERCLADKYLCQLHDTWPLNGAQ